MINNLVNQELLKELPWIKIQKVVYTQSNCCIDYFFIYDQYNNIDDKSKEKVASIVDKVVPIQAKKTYSFRKSYLLPDLIIKNIASYCLENFKSLNIKKENIDVEIIAQNVSVKINVGYSVFNLIEKLGFEKSLLNFLQCNFFADFEISINAVNEDNMDLSLLEKRQTMQVNTEYINNCLYEVKNIVQIYGKSLQNKAYPLSKLKADMVGVTIAGKIKFFNKAVYTKKQEKNGKTIEVEKVRYNFEIISGDDKISAVVFPVKALVEKGDIFRDGQEIIALCDVDEYKGRLSVKIREIGYCTLPEKIESQVQYLNENQDYLTIIPEKYIELNQINMFEQTKGLPKLLDGKTYVVFDLETTGLEYKYSEIIEIGAVKVVNGKITETFSTLIKPKIPITKDITEINGIDNEMVADAPSLEKVIPDFYKFTRDSILVAHNVSFDSKFLIYYGQKCLYNFDNELMDSLAMARQYLKSLKNHKLKTVCEYLGIDLFNAHRAFNDTLATAKCFIKLADYVK